MTGVCGYMRSVLVPKLLVLGCEVVATSQRGALAVQDRWHNLRWMQKAISQ
jgi:hypothetical protein